MKVIDHQKIYGLRSRTFVDRLFLPVHVLPDAASPQDDFAAELSADERLVFHFPRGRHDLHRIRGERPPPRDATEENTTGGQLPCRLTEPLLL